MSERDLGSWILPQPVEENKWVRIPRIGNIRTVPFGYKVAEDDEEMLEPIPFELEALEKAKLYLRQYSSRQVANWLTKTTGRYISHAGLLKRIKNEQHRRRKTATYRNIARRLEKALDKAQAYERALGKEGNEEFFERQKYRDLRDRAAAELA